MLASVRPYWPLLTALASGAMLATAHAFERFGGLAPCALCLDQREWHWGVAAVSLAAFSLLRFRPDWARFAAGAVGLTLLGSAGMAFYHVAVEQHWIVAQCEIDTSDLTIDFGAPINAIPCDAIAWQMFGVSMAGWNGIVSLLLAIASFAVALYPERKP